jgi:hypothetical protein
MNINITSFSKAFQSQFERDYNEDVYDTEEDLVKAYKLVLSVLVNNNIITILQSAEINDKLHRQMLYFKEWY